MKEQIINFIFSAWNALSHSKYLIIWNLFLAIIPFALSVWLFRTKQNYRNFFWWAIFLVFIAFLPNAPYILTDVIHLIQIIQEENYSVFIITLVLIPQYCLFILAGVECYVISVINLGYYLQKEGAGKYIFAMELITHLLSACGIYLGRFKRFNSWDFLTAPNDLLRTMVDDFTGKEPLFVIFVTFMVLTIIYWIFKQLTLATIFRVRHWKQVNEND